MNYKELQPITTLDSLSNQIANSLPIQKVTGDMIKDLRGRWELLAEFSGHVIDDALIAHLEKHHCTTKS